MDTAGIVAAEVAAAANAVDFFMHLRYQPRALIRTNYIEVVYDAHRACPDKRVRYASLMQAFWLAWPNAITDAVWPYRDALADDLASQIVSPGYQRVDGLPLVGIYNPGDVQSGTANTNWLAFLARLGQPVYLIGVGAVSTAAWTAARCVGGTTYGINGGNPTPLAIQHSWADQVTKDQSNAGQPGFALIECINYMRDPRGRQGDPASSGWSDVASIPDQETAIRVLQPQLPAARPRIIMLGTGTELDEEGGGMVPTAGQVSSTFTIGDRLMRVAAWARDTEARPGSCTYKQSSSYLYFTKVGAWTKSINVAGAYYGNEQVSSTPGDTLTDTTANANAHALTTRVRIFGRTGAGLGSATVALNGTPVGTASNVGGTATGVVIFDSGVLAAGAYQVSLTVLAGGTFSCDAIERTFIP